MYKNKYQSRVLPVTPKGQLFNCVGVYWAYDNEQSLFDECWGKIEPVQDWKTISKENWNCPVQKSCFYNLHTETCNSLYIWKLWQKINLVVSRKQDLYHIKSFFQLCGWSRNWTIYFGRMRNPVRRKGLKVVLSEMI